MSIFSGLGGGIAKGAQGFFQGGIAAEKENYRRSQVEQDREYKKQLLAARKKETDPHEKIRQQAGRTAQMILRMRANPADQAYFESPQGQEFGRRMEEIGNRLWGVHIGTIDPDDVDTYALSFAPVNTARPGEETAESLAGKQPFLRPPASAMAPPMGDLGGREPMPDQWAGGANIPLDAPPGAPLRPQLGPPAPAPVPAPPPKPPTPEERYWAHVNNPPKVEPMRGERPRDTEARRRALMDEHNQQTNLLYQAVMLGDKARKGRADATIAESDAGVRPALNRVKPLKAVADVQKARAERDLAIATKPTKVAQGQATLKKTKVETGLAPTREARAQRQAAETARHNRAMEEQARRAEANRISQAERTLRKESRGQEMAALRTELSAKLQRYQATRTYGPFRETTHAVQGADRQKLGADIDRIERRLQAIQRESPATKGGVTTIKSTRTTVGASKSSRAPTGVLGKKPAAKAKLPKGVNDNEYKAVAGLIGKGTFDNFARKLQGTDRARAKAIYKQKTGRDWGG
jgi:hypothetical protein